MAAAFTDPGRPNASAYTACRERHHRAAQRPRSQNRCSQTTPNLSLRGKRCRRKRAARGRELGRQVAASLPSVVASSSEPARHTQLNLCTTGEPCKTNQHAQQGSLDRLPCIGQPAAIFKAPLTLAHFLFGSHSTWAKRPASPQAPTAAHHNQTQGSRRSIPHARHRCASNTLPPPCSPPQPSPAVAAAAEAGVCFMHPEASEAQGARCAGTGT